MRRDIPPCQVSTTGADIQPGKIRDCSASLAHHRHLILQGTNIPFIWIVHNETFSNFNPFKCCPTWIYGSFTFSYYFCPNSIQNYLIADCALYTIEEIYYPLYRLFPQTEFSWFTREFPQRISSETSRCRKFYLVHLFYCTNWPILSQKILELLILFLPFDSKKIC